MSELFSNKYFDKSSGIYRTTDNIDNFKFRITLCKLDSLIKIPSFEPITPHLVSNHTNKGRSPRNDQPTEFVEKTHIKIDLKWQQKLFSNHELEYFSKIENLITETDKSYHNLIKTYETEKIGTKAYTIYTLVNRDKLEKYKQFLEHDVNFDSALNDDPNIEFMYIVADLKSTNKILFFIKFDRATTIFTIYPNFNTSKPYMAEIKSDSRDLYYYSVTNSSNTSSGGTSGKDHGTLTKFRIQPALYNKFILNNNFLVLLLFEIKYYKSYFYNFFNSFIFIKYKIVFPKQYKFSGDVPNTTNAYESVTNSCKYYFRPNSVIHINFSKEFSVLSERALNFSDNIRIVFTIMALDYWRRPKIIGHTYCTVPIKQGISEKILYSYTNFTQNSIFYNFDGFNFNKEDNLVRYGNETMTAGELAVRYNLLIQQNYNNHGASNEGDDKIENQNKSKCFNFMKLNDILTAYYEARRRFDALNG